MNDVIAGESHCSYYRKYKNDKEIKTTKFKMIYKLKKLKKSDNAVVGIVAAFLIVGLIVAVISVIQTQYVPKWMKEKEADHMNLLADQFAQLKYAIDTHMVNQRRNTPISTTITLGSKEMPYLMSMRAFGQLRILNNQFNITITRNDTTSYSYELGIIQYSSYNAYYINQDYIYECGGVILSQTSGNTMYIKPSISVSFEKNVTISFNIINISTIGNKDQSEHGYGPAPIQTEYIETVTPAPILNVSNITINTSYTNAWHSFLNSTLIKAGLNYAGYGTNYSINVSDRKVFVEFHDTINVNLELNIIKIGAQIAPGWVETRE